MRRLGIDMGSSSLGWLINEDKCIVKKGVITFDTGMAKSQSGGYASPTKDRREDRSKRNLIRARKYKKWALLKTLLNSFCPLSKQELEEWCKYRKGEIRKFPENENFLKWLACDFTYLDGEGEKYKNPYELRVKALDHKLHNHELGRVLYHLIQRRGYKDIGEADKETKKQKERREESGFAKVLQENRTIAEALVNEFLNKNERARNNYPYREEYECELETICKAQGYDISKNEEGDYKDTFVEQIWKAIIWQRPLRSQKGNIGKCTLEPKKMRCPISHPVFEIFRAWQFINTIKFHDENDEKQSLPPEFRQQLYNDLFLKKESNFKFEEIRKFLDKKFGETKKYNYPVNREGKCDTSVSGMPVCKGLIQLFGEKTRQALNEIECFTNSDAPKIIEQYSVYDLWHILFMFDKKQSKFPDFLRKFATQKLGIENVLRKRKGEEIWIAPLEELRDKFSQGYADLSLKAMCKIIPFLKEGYLYNEAVVLAKMPELLGENWIAEKEKIRNAVENANKIYEWEKLVVEISNNLVNKYKGFPDNEKFAYKDFQYTLNDDDLQDIRRCCEGKFGEKSWEKRQDKNEIINAVKGEYQAFFKDEKRSYRELQSLTEIFDRELGKQKIKIDSKALYHHSNSENKYLAKCKIENEKPQLPKAKNKLGVEVDVLPTAMIDSIKNPMFNKSMNILKKLINELIKDETIDKETEVVIELARELNDNNKRVAIERYQNERRNNREKYREFLEEFKKSENQSINIEKSIPIFELWSEQIFEQTADEKGNKVTNEDSLEILRGKDSLRRYELWMEQKGQCMYTGKMISISQLFSNDIDIEHTIPRSILPDNTMANQTVCYAWYNRNRDKKWNQLPMQCENYYSDKEGWGTRIEPRLDNWRQIRDKFKKQYEDRKRPNGNEDENVKNRRIQEKHYYKLRYDYWSDKIERFETEEVKDSWVRRQLVDTQMISKYAREFLKAYFKKVSVQKGIVTSEFRKIYGFQETDEIKQRNKHTHHIIDALVLTLIPTNSSHREKILKEYYKGKEEKDKQSVKAIRERELPPSFNSQNLINEIESSTLVYNYKKDKILKQSPKRVRRRGQIQYVKDKKGKYILNDNGEKIIKKSNGDTIRSPLFAQTYLGKIRDVERFDDGRPKRENEDWKYKQGKDAFCFVKRENIDKVKTGLIKSIVDPDIRKLVETQKNESFIKDSQGNTIRHVRVKVKVGQEVKERLNYRSRYEYKNKFYSESGSIPYAILLQKNNNGKIERKMLPIASFEIAKVYKKVGKFDVDKYVEEAFPNLSTWNKQLLNVGQKVFVLKSDSEFNNRTNIDFQTNRLYVINQFKYDGYKIMLKHHLEARSDSEIDEQVKLIKDQIIREKEVELEIPKIEENESLLDISERKKDYNKRINDFKQRLKIIESCSDTFSARKLKERMDRYKTESSFIEIEGQTPILGLSKNNWNFLFEGEDFEMNIDGTITFKD